MGTIIFIEYIMIGALIILLPLTNLLAKDIRDMKRKLYRIKQKVDNSITKESSELAILKREFTDLRIKDIEPKFERGHVVDITSYIASLERIHEDCKGTYLSREIDYDRSEWICNILYKDEVIEVPEKRIS